MDTTVQDKYKDFAALYDEFRGTDERYYDVTVKRLWVLLWFAFAGYKNTSGPVLDLGCGIGSYAIYLAEAGYKCVGVDLSDPMLEIGRKKAQEKGVAVPFIKQDIAELSLDQKFGCIFSNETLVHVEDIEKQKEVFRRCYDHLLPGGVFMFQFTTEKWAQEIGAENSEEFITFRWVHSGTYDPQAKIARLTYRFVYKKGGELIVPINFRVYSQAEFEQILGDVGFVNPRFMDAAHQAHVENGRVTKTDFYPLRRESSAGMCICRKP
jgi:2-polyprenyl-3-methyl-5-hydroxy-6-metoxy-1,4-benzoquinol methylase